MQWSCRKYVLLWLLVLSIIMQLPRPVAVADYGGYQLEMTDVKFEIDHIHIEFNNNGSEEITIIKCDIIWIADEYQVIPSTVTEVGTSQHLPISIPGYTTTTLDFSCNWAPGYYYQVSVGLSDNSGFSRDIGFAPTSISGVLLYKVNVNFYMLNELPKVDVDIGNCGTLEETVTELCMWGPNDEPRNLLSAPLPIQAGGRSRITLSYNWTSGETYQFKVVCDSGRSFSWTHPAPSWKQDETRDPVILSFGSESMTVEKDEIFTVGVLIENIPEDHGCAGIEFNLTWDSGILKALNMTEIMFHSVTPPEEHDNIWKLRHEVLNQSFAYYAYCWQDLNRAIEEGYAPVWGNHTLATITFKAVDTGSATLHLSLVKMGDSEPQPTVRSVDEPQAGGRIWTALLNYVLVDCKVNVGDENATDEVSDVGAGEDKSDTGLGSTAPVNQPDNAPQTRSYLWAIIALAAVAMAMVPTSIMAHKRRRKNSTCNP